MSKANPNRIDLYPSKAVADALFKMAKHNGQSVSKVACDLIERALLDQPQADTARQLASVAADLRAVIAADRADMTALVEKALWAATGSYVGIRGVLRAVYKDFEAMEPELQNVLDRTFKELLDKARKGAR